MSAKVSVIMGVYNDESYLAKAIESILNQTFKDFEFIICDDCSTDSSSLIIKKYALQDQRIKYMKNKENIGLASTLNKCISVSKGEYIARMDSDDLSLQNRLQTQFDYLEANKEVDVVGTLAYFIDENDKIYKEFNRKENVELKDAVKMSQVIHPTVMIRKKTLCEVQMYTVNENTQRAEDYDLWCKILEKNGTIKNIQEILFLYRESLNGLKKRKFKFRMQEAKLKYYWLKRTKQPIGYYIYAVKPIVLGFIPVKLMQLIRNKLLDVNR